MAEHRVRILTYSGKGIWIFLKDEFQNKEDAITWLKKHAITGTTYRTILLTGEYAIRPEPKLSEIETPIEDGTSSEETTEGGGNVVETDESEDDSKIDLAAEETKNMDETNAEMEESMGLKGMEMSHDNVQGEIEAATKLKKEAKNA